MFIPDPDFLSSRILDLRSNNSKKEVGGKIFLSYLVFVGINFIKLKIFFFCEKGTEKSLSQLTTNLIIFIPKNCCKSSQKNGLGIRDPRSRIREKLSLNPVSLGQKAPNAGSGSATLLNFKFLGVASLC
jgi:hypothetical protein